MNHFFSSPTNFDQPKFLESLMQGVFRDLDRSTVIAAVSSDKSSAVPFLLISIDIVD